MMRRILTVFSKETIDNLRDRRTLLTALLLGPLLGPLLFVFIMQQMLSDAISELEQPLQLPVVGAEYAPNLVQFLKQNHTKVIAPPEDPEAAVKNRKYAVVMVIPESYPEEFIAGEPATLQLIFDASDREADKDVDRARGLLEAYSKRISALRLLARGVNPAVLQPVIVDRVDLSTPEARAVLVLGIVPYFIVLTVLMGGFYLAIDTTAGERERGSLEPLLSTAASRAELAIGKLAATMLFAVLSLAITLISFVYGSSFIQLEELGMRANLSASVMFPIFVVSLPFALLASAMLSAVASFTKSFKEAQTWLSVIMIIPAIPAFITLLNPEKPELWMMVIPSYNISVLIIEFIKGETVTAAFMGTAMFANFIIGLALAWLAIRLYHREKVLG
ncbi:MAG: ABC transporter permease [Gammaproteobacteria bacterium]|nr:ABC transporter permease [Gammaproteobacteria bacterium]